MTDYTTTLCKCSGTLHLDTTRCTKMQVNFLSSVSGVVTQQVCVHTMLCVAVPYTFPECRHVYNTCISAANKVLVFNYVVIYMHTNGSHFPKVSIMSGSKHYFCKIQH